MDRFSTGGITDQEQRLAQSRVVGRLSPRDLGGWCPSAPDLITHTRQVPVRDTFGDKR